MVRYLPCSEIIFYWYRLPSASWQNKFFLLPDFPEPVSYTHLDVYKRQAWQDLKIYGKNKDQDQSHPELRNTAGYGSQDVYKRQV